MEKVIINREELKDYPKNKKSFKNYHKIKLNKNLSEKSVNPTVKLLYQVISDSKEMK
jgi:hypothetical protein